MIVNVISISVVIVFICILYKKTLLPRIALKRAAKAGQAVQTADSPSPAQPPSLADLMQAGRFSGQSLPGSRPVTCFDMRLVDLSLTGGSDGDTLERRITYAASEMLLNLCSRGASPVLGAVRITDDLLMLYATYAV